MVVVSMLPNADFGPNDHRDNVLHFIVNIASKPNLSMYYNFSM